MATKTYYLLKRFIDTSEKNIPVYIENLTSNNGTITLQSARGDATNVECSTDNVTWTAMTASGTNYTATLPANGKLYIRANATTWNSNDQQLISIGGLTYRSCNVGGNVMSLLYGSTFTGTETSFPDATKDSIFAALFRYCTAIKSAEKLALPVTTLATRCYRSMFQDCNTLTTAPILPATTLKDGCYGSMFTNCTALTAAPSLPATTLKDFCYQNMFSGCTALTAAPILPATTLTSYCYSNMFSGCTALTDVPALPATTLAQNCYSYMFYNCSSLNSITVGATSWNNPSQWVSGVSATGTFTKPSGTTIPEGISGIPSGWTVVNV